MEPQTPQPPRPQTYRWPWVVLVVVLAGLVVASVWTAKEAGKIRRIRDATYPTATNASPR